MSKHAKTTAKKKLPPASTPEARENQIIAAAMDLAEERILDGSASNSLLIHYLKLGSTRERLEKDLIEKKIDHMAASTKAIQAAERMDEMYTKAVQAMRRYGGQSDTNYDEAIEL